MTQSQRTSRTNRWRSMGRKTFAKRQWPTSRETRPTADSARPPNTGHFGEFQPPAPAKPSPEVEADKQVTEIRNPNPSKRIHHQHHPVAESGDTVPNG